MQIKGILKGFKKGVTKAGNPAFEAYLELDEDSGKRVTFSKDGEIVGTVLHTIKCWGPDASTCFDICFNEKLLNKPVIAIGNMTNFTFNPCLLQSAK